MLKIKECKKIKKICRSCGKLKFIYEFEKEKGMKDGHRNQCKKCRNKNRWKNGKKRFLAYYYNGKKCVKFMKVCKDCGRLKLMIEFSKDKKHLDKRFNKCKKCYDKNSKQRYIFICKQCGKEFTSRYKDAKFCSIDCHNKNLGFKQSKENNPNWNGGIEYKCEYCGGYSQINKYAYNQSKHHFCSQKCKAEWQKENLKNENNPCYNPNLTEKERELRRNFEGYSIWRGEVYRRDNYICQCCNNKNNNRLVAHHLNAYHWDKEHRTDINNGVTLCEKCHKKFHKIYGNKNNTKEQFEEFKIRFKNGEFKEVV